MRSKRMGLILLVHLILFSSCGSKTKTDRNSIEFLSLIDFNRLYTEWSHLTRKISDSGTIGNVALNMPDTVFMELNSRDKLEKFFKNFITINGHDSMQAWISKMNSHGLHDTFYHNKYLLSFCSKIKKEAWSSSQKIPYDSLSKYILFVTDALTGMFHDLSCGRVNPGFTGSIYSHNRRWINHSGIILKSETPFRMLAAAEPGWKEYKKLQKELMRVRSLIDQTGEGKVLVDKPIKEGDFVSSEFVLLTGRRLRLLGYSNLPDSVLFKMKSFTTALAASVKSLQVDYELKATGDIDKSTARILSYSQKAMVQSLEGDLERMRWLGYSFNKKRIWVNIAENKLYGIRNDSVILEMRTCSGEPRGGRYYERLLQSRKKDSKILPPDNLETPLFSAPITHIVANPTWHVPRNILVKEMLPELKRNPEMLNKLGYVLKDSKGKEIDAKTIDWKEITPGKVNFRIEQTTGNANSLGLVVIYLLNPYSIFLHDTPAKWAFSLDERHVSHGCVRLEEPFKLVEFLMSFNKKDNYDKLRIAAGLPPEHDQALLNSWKKSQKILKDSGIQFKPQQDKRFNLDSNIQVYLIYFTMKQGVSGSMIYMKDSYNYNRKMEVEMRKPGRKRLFVQSK